MKKYLVNALSLNMFASAINAEKESASGNPTIYPVIEVIGKEEIPTDIVSAIGHADTANILSSILGFEILPCRISVDIGLDDELYIAQYMGTRLEEGATTLPEGAHFEFFKVRLGRAFPAEMCPGGVVVPLKINLAW